MTVKIKLEAKGRKPLAKAAAFTQKDTNALAEKFDALCGELAEATRRIGIAQHLAALGGESVNVCALQGAMRDLASEVEKSDRFLNALYNLE